MATPSFIGIPLELREQIYTELLTFQPSSSDPDSAPSSSLCCLFSLNRQVHSEVLTFLQSRLLVLLKTNDSTFVQNVLDEEWRHGKTPLVSQLYSRDGTVKKQTSGCPIAMELEFYMHHHELPVRSYPAFLMPATSITTLLEMFWKPAFHVWNMHALLTFNFLNRFSHTHEEAQNQLIAPWLAPTTIRQPAFFAISTNPAIDADLATQLKQSRAGNNDAITLFKKIQVLQSASLRKRETEEWDAAAEKSQMAVSFANALWDFHEDYLESQSKATGFDYIHHLWRSTASVYINYTEILLNNATDGSATDGPATDFPTGIPGASDPLFAQARAVAEEAIRLMRSHNTWNRVDTKYDLRSQKVLRKSKAKISLQAHAACKGMGDVTAAVGYLREALDYRVGSKDDLSKRIEDLKLEGARDDRLAEGVVSWEPPVDPKTNKGPTQKDINGSGNNIPLKSI